MELLAQLEATQAAGVAAFAEAADADAVEAVRIAYLGRSGAMKALKDAFKAAAPEVKRTVGRALGSADQALKAACEARLVELSSAGASAEAIDVTLPVGDRRVGSMHPISQVAAEVEQVFTSMGFDIVDGPHIEEDEFNFSRLNIPDDHPARDAQDTFWLNTGKLLRTHTSSVQSRTYPNAELPLRKVVVGKVFRYEEVDATHDNTFTQVEGFVVDEHITVAHLVGTVETMIRAVLQRDDVEIRLRPSFFPFVEPGFEVDVRSTSPDAGRFSSWVELLGCGMIHPKVLKMGGIDPERYQGFAFGLGLERLTMIRHGIDDIRLFNGADLRGLRQFV
ncbi:MAG: phenylalanine--tRNA ligase subunit alpha [Planctomycetota bacterium]|jgi:phenylalanyl-tRNA synthetase alpha chain